MRSKPEQPNTYSQASEVCRICPHFRCSDNRVGSTCLFFQQLFDLKNKKQLIHSLPASLLLLTFLNNIVKEEVRDKTLERSRIGKFRAQLKPTWQTRQLSSRICSLSVDNRVFLWITFPGRKKTALALPKRRGRTKRRSETEAVFFGRMALGPVRETGFPAFQRTNQRSMAYPTPMAAIRPTASANRAQASA